MGGESATRMAPRSGGTGRAPVGSKTGQRLSGLAVALGLVLFLGGFAWAALVYRPYTVPTSSMAPTIKIGDRVLAQRVDGSEIRRGDVVVFEDRTWVTGSSVVKRVVAVGGDSIGFEDGILVRNGRPVTEPYTGDFLDGVYYGPDVVPPGQLYLLGDNRFDSIDSRSSSSLIRSSDASGFSPSTWRWRQASSAFGAVV